jgi:2-succinyl-5-enolpyruvyl-6-hydroxy-3-cyclohexene-1-carboxylate synthase
VAPGSRSTPLALALARDGRVRVHVVLDERSAAFLALGIGVASGRAAVVLCTSGTAAVNFHPAVAEADQARVPMLVCTADRPPELQGVGAPQTIDQQHLFGGAVRWFCDPGPPAGEPGAAEHWRSTAARAVAAAHGSPPGPVHLNLPFREPLLPTGAPLVDAPGRPSGEPWTVSTSPRGVFVESVVDSTNTSGKPAVPAGAAGIDDLAALVGGHSRGLVVAGFGARAHPNVVGRFAKAVGWPVLADPVSGLRSGAAAVSTYEALMRAERFAAEHRPDVVLRLGAPLTSRAANAWLRDVPRQVVIDPDGRWPDPDRAATDLVRGSADALLGAVAARADTHSRADGSRWFASWMAVEARARAALDAALDARGDARELTEARIARDLADALPGGAALVVASSLPVRALEWTMRPRADLRVLANRGVNGIDGFVSTVLGVALAAARGGGPTIGFLGDLCFLHDTNGLLGAARRGVDSVFVVVDNDGGGIFEMLPQSSEPEFEMLFATPHGLDLVDVARAHGVEATRAEGAAAVRDAVTAAIAAGGVRVVIAPVDRSATVERTHGLWDAVARAV